MTNPSTVIDVSSNEQNHNNKDCCSNNCYCCVLFKRHPSVGCCLIILTVVLIIVLLGTCIRIFNGKYERKISPKFSMEAIRASNINFSPSPNSFLSAQNLTIDFVVENHAPTEVQYKNMEVSISYRGSIVWLSTLGLYHQQEGERSSMQVTFCNFPIKIMDEHDVYALTKENSTSGFGVFTVDVKGNYGSRNMNNSCGDVRLKFSQVKQETRLLQKCSTHFYTIRSTCCST